MTVRSRSLLAAAVGVWFALPAVGQEPARLGLEASPVLSPRADLSPNQRVANSIADHLRQSARLRGYRVDVVFQDGIAELSGTVADQAQREEALRIVQGVPGVDRVRDRLTLPQPVTQAQVVIPPPGAESIHPPLGDGIPIDGAQGLPPDALPGGPGMPTTDPVPFAQAPPPSPYDVAPPKMPPYAWPTYAPYNNYSRVAYPNYYPYNAWPFIGPIYPFPKVPPGWRSVKLEWQDGYWWYSTHSNSHCWWRLRYW